MTNRPIRVAKVGGSLFELDGLANKLKSWLADPTPERGGRAKRFYALRPVAVSALKENRRTLLVLWRGLEARLT